MDISIVNKINATPYKAFFAIAGGGQSFIGDYCRIFGASATVVGAIIPYDRTIFNNFVGKPIETYASSEAARKLALASFNECLKTGIPKEFAIGIGAASSVVKENERIGRKHKLYVASHTIKSTVVLEVILNQERTRAQEDAFVSDMIYQLLARVTLNEPIDIKHNAGEVFNIQEADEPYIQRIISGTENVYCSSPKDFIGRVGIYPGSWNPMHEAHQEIKKMSERILNIPVFLELTIANTDKPMLDFIEVRRRFLSIYGHEFLLTNASTFVQKVNLINESYPSVAHTYILGADTWNRLWDEKYGYSRPFLEDFFHKTNTQFLVFGRNNEPLVSCGESLRIKSPEAENFKLNISSSEIRRRTATHE